MECGGLTPPWRLPEGVSFQIASMVPGSDQPSLTLRVGQNLEQPGQPGFSFQSGVKPPHSIKGKATVRAITIQGGQPQDLGDLPFDLK